MIEFILGTFIVVLIRNKIVSNINSKAGKELYLVYKLKSLFKNWQLYLIFVFVMFYIYCTICVLKHNYWFIPYQSIIKALIIVSYIPLALKYNLIYKNCRDTSLKSILFSPLFIGCYCMIIGTVLNLIAMYFNNGKMPVFPTISYTTGYANTFVDNQHIFGNIDTKFIPLCDIFDSGYMCFSIGDLIFRFYSGIILFFSIKKAN